MVYVEAFITKGKQYYRLVHTIRKGEKTTHKTKYIGKVLPPKERLEQLKREFLRELIQGKYAHLSQEDVEQLGEKRNIFQRAVKQLSKTEFAKQIEEFIIRFTYDSSKLSGVDITLRQTHLILKEGIIPQEIKQLKTVKEIENHQKGAVMLTTYRGALTLEFIQKLHRILMNGVDDALAGKLRSELKRNVKIAGTSYVPPSWQTLEKEIAQFFKWYKSEGRKLHPVELASLLHLKLVSLQPFVDGNSRIARLLMNWVLWKKGYPPANLPVSDLEEYYKTLDLYQIERQEKPFVHYIKKYVLEQE